MSQLLAPLWQRCLPLISGLFSVALLIVGILLDSPPKAFACFLGAYAMLGISAWSLWRKNRSDIANFEDEVARLQEAFEHLKDLGTVEVDLQAKRRHEVDRHLAGLSDAEKCALRQLLFINGLFSEQLEAILKGLGYPPVDMGSLGARTQLLQRDGHGRWFVLPSFRDALQGLLLTKTDQAANDRREPV